MTSRLRILALVFFFLSGGWSGGLAGAYLPVHDATVPWETSVLDSEDLGVMQRAAARLRPQPRNRKILSGSTGGVGAHPVVPTGFLSGSKFLSFTLSCHRDLQRFREVRRI